MDLFWSLCIRQFFKWVQPYSDEIFFLTYLALFTLPASAEQFYEHFSRSQKITHQQLQNSVNYKLSSFYSINLILSSTPSIKFYADLLSEEGLPIDLAVIPLMESGNNPQAKSPKDALGLWQFIPSTAKEWGLLSSQGTDDRKNVIESTRAAISYLNYLHKHFDDWNLALAAYNWGMGNVSNALKRGLVKNNQIDLSLLPKETANYLVAFHHLNRLIKLSYNNDDFKKFPNQPYLDMIKQNDMKNYINKNNILGINPDVLVHINGYDVGRHNPANPDILVPNQTFVSYFLTTKISYKPVKKKSGCLNTYYRARRGDSITTLTEKFKIKVSQFNEINPGIYHLRPGMLVKVCP